jgi:hypothetical protein
MSGRSTRRRPTAAAAIAPTPRGALAGARQDSTSETILKRIADGMQKQQQDMAEMSRDVRALHTKTNALQEALDEAAPRLPDEESEPPRAPARPAGEGGSSAGTGVRDNARGGASISSSGGGGGSEDILARLAGMFESLRTPNPPSALAEERARLNSAIEKAEEEVRAQEEELERAQLKAATLRSKGAGGRGRDCDVEYLGALSSAEPSRKRPVPQAARPTAAAAAAAAAARDNAAMSATNAEFSADDTTGQGTHPEALWLKPTRLTTPRSSLPRRGSGSTGWTRKSRPGRTSRA